MQNDEVVQVHVRLGKPLAHALKEAARQSDEPQSILLRRLLRRGLEQELGLQLRGPHLVETR